MKRRRPFQPSFVSCVSSLALFASAQTHLRITSKYRENGLKAELFNGSRDTLMAHSDLSAQRPLKPNTPPLRNVMKADDTVR